MPLGMPTSNGQTNTAQPTLVRIGSADNTNDYVDLDATIKQTHSKQSMVSDYPIEQGSNVADNVRPRPNIIRLHGIVSQTPDLDCSQGDATHPPGPNASEPVTRVSQARTTLIKYRDQGMLVTVSTAREVYANMVVIEITEDVEFANGNDFEATIVCQQISVATSQLVAAPKPATPIATAKQDKSDQTLTPDPNTQASALYKLGS